MALFISSVKTSTPATKRPRPSAPAPKAPTASGGRSEPLTEATKSVSSRFAMRTLLHIRLIALVGCNSGSRRPIKPVTVTLKYKGAPVEGATITFISDEPDAPAAFGKTDAQGVAKPRTPELGNGVILGTHKVLVNKEQIVNEKKAADQESAEYAPGITAVPQVKHLVPVKYNAPGTTPLTAEVTQSGPAEFSFDLTD